jgi:thermitase
MITGLMLILLLTNIIVTTFNVTPVFANIFNSSTKTDTLSDELLKGVDPDEKAPTSIAPSQNKPKNFWDLNPNNQSNNPISYSSKDSTQLIVGLSETWDSYKKVEQIALAKNGRIVNKIMMGNKVDAVVIDMPPESHAAFTTEIKENGLSRYVEPNLQYQAFFTPNDPYWNQQWGPVKIQADYAWNTTTGSNTVLVCVIDTGVDYNHPDLAANYVPLGYDWVNMDSDPMDDMGHGTHCAGIIGAVINNSVGIAGLAQVSIMAEKGLDAGGGGYYDDLANAIIDATDKGANIISMSWGGGSQSTVLHDALKYAYDHGVLLVAAAGNSGSSTKGYPAAYDEVIAVTATDSGDNPAYFTTYGDWVELAAPGVDIYSTISAVHDPRFIYPYDSLSGTSMACPHVVGVAALVWSQFPDMARDVLSFHLRDTADDLGAAGFDIYYGYGRINARKAVEQPLPEHDLIITSWKRPPYVEPGNTGTINATLINYGSNNETSVSVQLLVNGTIEYTENISNFPSGTLTSVSLLWSPSMIGNYNVTVYVLPVDGETKVENNVIQGYVYVDFPLKVFVLRSSGTQDTTDTWDRLNYNWKQYGDQLIHIDYTTLDKDDIIYDDLKATDADVLILSCAYAWPYTNEEIDAIKQYVYEGHGFIATAGTIYYGVPNNNKFAPMFGLTESMLWDVTGTDLMTLLNPSHPVLAGIPNPYTMPAIQTSIPFDGAWSSNELAGGTYIAMGYYNESAIVTYQGLVFISPWLELIPERYQFNFQILYNAMTWSRYQKPEHELVVSLEAPEFVFQNSSVLLNATVLNNGVQNESDVDFHFSVYDISHNKSIYSQQQLIPLLESSESYTTSYLWNSITSGTYNVTAYASPVSGENNTANNKATVLVTVASPIIEPKEGQWTRYLGYYAESSGSMVQPVLFGEIWLDYFKYISSYQMNVTVESITYGQSNMTSWTVVNIMNRVCESGLWQDMWFPGMIETPVFNGSTVYTLGGPATVIGSEVLFVGTKVVDCWKLYQNYMGIANYTWWYDKTDGLWIRLEYTYGSTTQIIMLDGTNIPTGFAPEHELLVTLDAPSFIELGNSSMLNATVFNYGSNNETNVELKLEINGTQVLSLIIFNLAPNDSRTLHHLWSPSAEGTYNVTAYTEPKPGEIIASNNVATAMVRVRTIKGYVLFDQTHATDSLYYYNTWIANLQDAGYVVSVNLMGIITSDVLAGYDVFVIIQAHTPYSAEELNAIHEFVANGGGLLVVGDDYPTLYTDLTAFANISWTSGGASGYTAQVTPHEVTEGVSLVYIAAPAAMMYISGNAQALVRDYYSEIMLAVNWYERGRVLGFSDEDSLSDYGIGSADNLRLAANMIMWLCKEDITPPTIQYITPSNETVIGTTTVQMHWLAMDTQSGIKKYSVYRNEQFVGNTSIGSYVLSNLVEGSNNVTIVAYDRAGNSASGHVTVFVDLTPPAVEILTPMNNSYVKGVAAINVSGFDENFDHMNLFISTEFAATYNTNGTHTYLWNTTLEYYVSHQITLVGYDTVGNNASITILVTVDNILPMVVLSSPENNAYVSGNITFAFVARDLALKNASLIIGDRDPIDAAGITSYSFNTAILTDGNYTIELVAYDLAGNKAETSITITIDNTPPTVQITSPTENSYVKGTVNVTFAFADSNLEKATLSIDGQIFDVTATTYHTWVTTATSDGSHILTLTVLDKAGNTNSTEITVIVDNTAPGGAVFAPLNGAYLRGDFNITFYAYDANPYFIGLYIDNGVAFTAWNVSATFSKLWDTASSADKTWTIRLDISDKAGNQFTMSITVTTDNTAPMVSIVSPKDNAPVSGTTIINFTAIDNDFVYTVSLFIDNAQVSIPLGQTSYQWDTTKTVDGNHTIKITATDLAGNIKEAAITVKTSNATPNYVWYAVIGATGVLGLAAGALTVWLLFRRKPAPISPSTPTSTSV